MMFELADKDKIGQYLNNRINKQFQENHRQFCRKYLEEKGVEASDKQLRRMSNRLSQILNGKNEIQLYDLPLFCQLLEVSCEDILSAGKNHAPSSGHLTNYAVALSNEERVWEKYINGEDSPITCAKELRKDGFEYAVEIDKLEDFPILHADEYGKTVIDYALEAENYDFLKYLMDRKYIWFVGEDEKECFMGFGAGTSIERAVFPYRMNWNVLNSRLRWREGDNLRTNMAALAIQNGDIEMLDRLRAREIPALYTPLLMSCTRDDYQYYYNEKMMEALVQADINTLEYFAEEFEITDRYGHVNRFIFPYLGDLLERLLQAKNDFAEELLTSAIRHNQYVYDQLTLVLAEMVHFYEEAKHVDITKAVLEELHFNDDGSLVSYYEAPLKKDVRKCLESNIIRVNVEDSDTMLKRQISELNRLYEAIHQIAPKYEGGNGNGF